MSKARYSINDVMLKAAENPGLSANTHKYEIQILIVRVITKKMNIEINLSNLLMKTLVLRTN
jgi:hypothetical protein